MVSALRRIRDATVGTEWEGCVYLVGGAVRDRLRGVRATGDLDLAVLGDAVGLAEFLYTKGIATTWPATYGRFGTASVRIGRRTVELAQTRSESYAIDSRKPSVKAATLEEDALRRDFTVNALYQNLHTGEIWDSSGVGLADLKARLLRTPRDPDITFHDDPLRMMRAVRFAVLLEFEIEESAAQGIRRNAQRLKVISAERIREEWTKTLSSPKASRGMRMLLDLGLLAQFAPELLPMVGCEQGGYHLYDVWDHSLAAMDNLSEEAGWRLRLAALLHDAAKPQCRTWDGERYRFFGHEDEGEGLARRLMRRLTFSNRDINRVAALVRLHMRAGSYKTSWSMGAVRRLMRDAGSNFAELTTLVEADAKARRPSGKRPDMADLRRRADAALQPVPTALWSSPLSGKEIMEALGLTSGPEIGRLKHELAEKVIEGEIAPGDKEAALKALVEIARKPA
ncbi:MAG: HD domain-containing protein [Armatimonadetes bacterium]|nr:HD domain-containing protein [Armatimonadota bacterium]